MEKVKISTEFIKLDQLLKFTNICSSGTDAKFIIQNSDILVNGESEKRRGRKLFKGDKVEVMGKIFLIE
ncbi:S4 domain-containing protein YaaA [Citroniella saccharovorans]|uniref:S4 domain-containing protein YaaA n=1 Tax=Citroniella saccharovorans TaxID=2053367 RepID=A0AAW9MXC8_9FIRM|nr:S4 domain-containing protein YaaA [Citroniella saccharovorans]MEB3428697.1 S4 domain-containing protein YaaA [Citroniella saccharovorans]